MKQDYALMNNVDSKSQLVSSQYVEINRKSENALRVLFVGNSITRHAPKLDIGWPHDWGMAASKKENDYVHRVVSGLEEWYGDVSFCIAQAAVWERDYPKGQQLLETYYQPARDFQANWVVIRLGENVPKELLQNVEIKSYFEEMICFFASNPDAKVIVTNNFWPKDTLDVVLEEIAKEHGYLFCKLNDLPTDQRTMALGLFEHQGVAVHPSDYGMACIAERILSIIRMH